MPRKNKIVIRTGSVAPTASDFVAGEPAWDSSNSKFYVKNAAGTMVEIGAGAGGATEVYEYATASLFPATGSSAVLYIETDTGRVFRWAGSTNKYVEIGTLSANTPAASLQAVGNSGTSKTLSPSDLYGGVLSMTLNGNCTVTMPALAAGQRFTLLLAQDSTGGRTCAFTGVRWPGSSAPTITASAASMDVLTFVSDGSYWYGFANQNFYTGSGDTYWSYVQLLLSMNGTNGSTTFTDTSSAARTITATNATISTAQSKFGGASGLFNTAYLSAPASSSLVLNTDFAIELWYYPTSIGSYNTVISDNRAWGANSWAVNAGTQGGGSNSISVWVNNYNTSSPILSSGANQLTTNTWHYIAITKSGTSANLYINGTRLATTTFSGNFSNAATDQVYVGCDNGPTNYAIGYIDDVRLTVGSARGLTGATITTPTSAFYAG